MMILEAEKYLGANTAEKYRLMDYYNNNCYQHVLAKRKYKIKRSDNWCAMFVTVIANRCGLSSEQFPYEVSVFFQVQRAKVLGTFYTDINKVKPNDLIIYDWDSNGVLDHVGIVSTIGVETMRVIEGNKSDTVGYRVVSKTSKAIAGFIRVDLPVKQTENERITALATQTLQGKFGNGEARKQALGGDYEAVQALINNYWQD